MAFLSLSSPDEPGCMISTIFFRRYSCIRVLSVCIGLFKLSLPYPGWMPGSSTNNHEYLMASISVMMSTYRLSRFPVARHSNKFIMPQVTSMRPPRTKSVENAPLSSAAATVIPYRFFAVVENSRATLDDVVSMGV